MTSEAAVPPSDLAARPRTILGWWTSAHGGWVHLVAVDGAITNPSSVARQIKLQMSLSLVLDVIGIPNRVVVRTLSVPAATNPGPKVLRQARDEFAADLGWSDPQ